MLFKKLQVFGVAVLLSAVSCRLLTEEQVRLSGRQVMLFKKLQVFGVAVLLSAVSLLLYLNASKLGVKAIGKNNFTLLKLIAF